MIRKLLFAGAMLPLSGFAQSVADAEHAAKMQAALENQSTFAVSAMQQPMDCDAVMPPYLENFEGVTIPALPDCTSAINAGTGNVWTTAQPNSYGFTSKTLRYTWNTTSPANTWFFTKPLMLEAGQAYAISYRYGSAGASLYTEKFKVHVGTGASVAEMDATPLIDHPLVNNNVTPITDNLTFTPTASGVYYLGFHCYSNTDQFYLFVDDISVTGAMSVGKKDAKTAVVFPNPVRDIVNVDNFGSEIESIAVYNMLGQKVVSRNGGNSSVSVDVSPLAPGNYILEVKGETVSRIKFSKH